MRAFFLRRAYPRVDSWVETRPLSFRGENVYIRLSGRNGARAFVQDVNIEYWRSEYEDFGLLWTRRAFYTIGSVGGGILSPLF